MSPARRLRCLTCRAELAEDRIGDLVALYQVSPPTKQSENCFHAMIEEIRDEVVPSDPLAAQ